MGQTETIGSSVCISQWAHPGATIASLPKAIGLAKAIGSDKGICEWAYSGSLQVHPAWAQLENSPTSLNGPTRNIQLLSNNGPMWAFPSSPVKLHMGFSSYHDKYLLHYVNFIPKNGWAYFVCDLDGPSTLF
jgi:hypothetical protein